MTVARSGPILKKNKKRMVAKFLPQSAGCAWPLAKEGVEGYFVFVFVFILSSNLGCPYDQTIQIRVGGRKLYLTLCEIPQLSSRCNID